MSATPAPNGRSSEAERYGRYEVIRKIASGGMGEVYLAKSVGAAGFQKHVVIKKILPHLTEHPQTVKGLVREAKLLVMLNHPNIVQVFDLGVEGNDYFMAMEYVHGYNLSSVLHYCSKKKTIIPATACALIAIEVLNALAYAHELRSADGTRQNIIHRDVSPQNVMISYSGQVKLTDFGIAKVLSEAEDELTQSLKGKWRYMAPEALDGAARIDQRYDLFAVGILLFEALCRRNLFSGKRDVDILNQVREAKIPPITNYHPHAPHRLVEVTNRALTKKPEERYQSAREFAQALRDAIHPTTESHAAEELRAFIAQTYDQPDFPLNKPKLVDPNAAESDATRSLVLRSRLSDVTPAGGHRGRARIAIGLLSVGLVLIGSVVAYMAYALLYRPPLPGDTKGPVIVVAPRGEDASRPAPSPPDAAIAMAPEDEEDASGSKKSTAPLPRAPAFNPEIGMRSIAKHQPALSACFSAHALGNQSVAVMTVVSTIRASGTVAEVKLRPSELGETALGRCVVQVASKVKYPRHNKPTITFVLPLRLKGAAPKKGQ